MLTVYKYAFAVQDTVEIEMPTDARIIHVDHQEGVSAFVVGTGWSAYGALVLWAVVDTDEEPETRILHVRGTGHPFTGEEGEHLGSVLIERGRLVWHVFEHALATA